MKGSESCSSCGVTLSTHYIAMGLLQCGRCCEADTLQALINHLAEAEDAIRGVKANIKALNIAHNLNRCKEHGWSKAATPEFIASIRRNDDDYTEPEPDSLEKILADMKQDCHGRRRAFLGRDNCKGEINTFNCETCLRLVNSAVYGRLAALAGRTDG